MSGFVGYKIIVVGGVVGIGFFIVWMMVVWGGVVGVIDWVVFVDDVFVLVMVDLMDVGVVQQVMMMLVKMLGGIDILVNCVGIDFEVVIEDVSDEVWVYVIDVNLLGLMWICCVVFFWFKVLGWGVIVNVFFVVGLCLIVDCVVYCLVKVGLVMLLKFLVFDWVKYVICVNIVCFGVVYIDFFDCLWQGKEDL